MDECLDWQARPLPANHPYNFRTFMERHFYGGIPRSWRYRKASGFGCCRRLPSKVEIAIDAHPIDITVGGWGQDGHVAYNQARRHPYSAISLEELAASTIRIQENNFDTILALAQRSFGSRLSIRPSDVDHARHAGVPLRQKSARVQRHRLLETDRLAGGVVCRTEPEYPMTLLQRHADALITATEETASHPISENPDWELL